MKLSEKQIELLTQLFGGDFVQWLVNFLIEDMIHFNDHDDLKWLAILCMGHAWMAAKSQS